MHKYTHKCRHSTYLLYSKGLKKFLCNTIHINIKHARKEKNLKITHISRNINKKDFFLNFFSCNEDIDKVREME